MKQAIECQNSVMQGLGQPGGQSGFVNNLPLQGATVEDFNRTIQCSANSSQSQRVEPMHVNDEAPFGTHIREAIAIIKDWRNS
jgi:hypothetical protein